MRSEVARWLEGEPERVSVIQGFGSTPILIVHAHMLVLDCIFAPRLRDARDGCVQEPRPAAAA